MCDAIRIAYRIGDFEEAARLFASRDHYGRQPTRGMQLYLESLTSDEACHLLDDDREAAHSILSTLEIYREFMSAAEFAEDEFAHLPGMQERVRAYRRIADFYHEMENEANRVWAEIVDTGRIIL